MGTTKQRVVVGVDGSAGGRLALSWALAEAVRRDADLEVLAAFPVDFYWTDAYLVDRDQVDALRADTEARARALVDDLRSQVAGAADLAVDVVVCAGAPAAHLVQRAEGAGLLVVGSRGRGAVRSSTAGSVALHCAAHARCPVVVVHPAAVAASGPGRVVVGLDGSDHARAALTAAVAEAAVLGADVEAVVAHEPPNHWSDLYAVVAPPAGESAEHAQRRGAAIVREVLGAEAPAVHVVAVEGHPVPVLMDRAQGASLLVLGSRSRNQLAGVVLGSVALHAVMHAPCPVLVVHPSRAAVAPAAG
ncbi:universal stress protein [Petropleomorpha daqingensis]|uniref:Nucleotide-binding universal stress UspA family protein n=1 Tax=Petropleomorpha daqingensis TaxID=2026353 RepID=A0A853CMU2_9ACTN|nr:nucleotide-binding universal stress UspA family protein [Petropleomorpha daqingensis]